MVLSALVGLGVVAITTVVAVLLVRALAEMRRQVGELQGQMREDAQRGRAESAEKQGAHLAALQRQSAAAVESMQRQLEEVRRSMEQRLHGLTGTVAEQLQGSSKLMTTVSTQMGALSETARQLETLGRDITGLHDILAAPKLRGNLGEVLLEDMLKQVLPAGHYVMQYRLAAERGATVIVDAVVRLGERWVPIDAKFPLESFQRLLAVANDDEARAARKAFYDAVRKQIDAIAQKYIRPDAGTYDFALMYLPAERIYYEAATRDEARELVDYAARSKVVLVSPNTLYAYLITVAYGLKGMQIERQAELLRVELAGLGRRFGQFLDLFEKVGRNLELAHKHHDDAARRGVQLAEQMNKISGAAVELEDPGQLSLPEATVDDGVGHN